MRLSIQYNTIQYNSFPGIFYAFAIFGPGVGYLAGGAFLSFYTDFDQVDTSAWVCTELKRHVLLLCVHHWASHYFCALLNYCVIKKKSCFSQNMHLTSCQTVSQCPCIYYRFLCQVSRICITFLMIAFVVIQNLTYCGSEKNILLCYDLRGWLGFRNELSICWPGVTLEGVMHIQAVVDPI